MLEELIRIHLAKVAEIKSDFQRYLYKQINWKERLIGIIGARGVGKTTLILQYYKENYKTPEDCLYISCDNVMVISEGLLNIAKNFFALGGKALLLDEIHKYPSWSQELKNIYDSFPNKQIVFSGSSSLDIIKGKYDLSRRAVIYQLIGLSFREYLRLELGLNIERLDLEEILRDHARIAARIIAKIPVLKYFKKYLQFGYYPFYLEGMDSYYQKINNVIEKIVYEDIPSVFPIKLSSVPVLKKIIYLIATSQPFSPNIERMSSALRVSKEYIYLYLDYLSSAGLFNSLYPTGVGFRMIRKPSKIYLENPNLSYTLGEKERLPLATGAIRECFFLNQVGKDHRISYPKKGDFLVDEKFIFEIGGKNKGSLSIKGKTKSFLALDDLEIGFKNRIPLYLFGFLY
jgi:predicted AAA+ superfamily ATPase